MIYCPKCHGPVDAGCSDPDCICHENYKPEDMLIYRMLLFGRITLSDKFGTWLWHALWDINIPASNLIAEVRDCPRCGYRMSYGAWEDLDEDEGDYYNRD